MSCTLLRPLFIPSSCPPLTHYPTLRAKQREMHCLYSEVEMMLLARYNCMTKGSLQAGSGGVEGVVVRGKQIEVAPLHQPRGWGTPLALPTECTEEPLLTHPPPKLSLMH
ncbi:hypothetical protein INR49_024426 [Caranx melampygus]|nr:hypothetical protein INR49_024426 [Caranx melampygus]